MTKWYKIEVNDLTVKVTTISENSLTFGHEIPTDLFNEMNTWVQQVGYAKVSEYGSWQFENEEQVLQFLLKWA